MDQNSEHSGARFLRIVSTQGYGEGYGDRHQSRLILQISQP